MKHFLWREKNNKMFQHFGNVYIYQTKNISKKKKKVCLTRDLVTKVMQFVRRKTKPHHSRNHSAVFNNTSRYLRQQQQTRRALTLSPIHYSSPALNRGFLSFVSKTKPSAFSTLSQRNTSSALCRRIRSSKHSNSSQISLLLSFAKDNNNPSQRRSFTNQNDQTQKKGLLDGIRVLDFTRILAGPYATMQLGDIGAEVIKIESLSGDDTRKWGPPFTQQGHESAYFLALNRNKKSLAVNLKTPQGRQVIYDLVAHCDLVVENWVPGRAEKLGIDYQSLKQFRPDLIYAAISGYGQTGPYAHNLAYDVVVSGYGGLMAITGSPDGQPVKTGVALTDVCAGLSAVGSLMAALYSREKTGQGQKIEVSLLETQVASLANVGSNYLIGGIEPGMWGTQHQSIVPYQHFETASKQILIGALNDGQWNRLCHAIERPDLGSNPNLSTNSQRVENRKYVTDELQKTLKTRNCDEWVKILDQNQIPVAPINPLSAVFSDPQVLHCKMVQEIHHPTAGQIKLTGPPVKFSDPQPGIASPPPLLGQHTRAILQNVVGYDSQKIDMLASSQVIKEYSFSE